MILLISDDSSLFALFSNSELKEFYDFVFDLNFEIRESNFIISFSMRSFRDEGFSVLFYRVTKEQRMNKMLMKSVPSVLGQLLTCKGWISILTGPCILILIGSCSLFYFILSD